MCHFVYECVKYLVKLILKSVTASKNININRTYEEALTYLQNQRTEAAKNIQKDQETKIS